MPKSTITAMYRSGDRRTQILLLSCGHKQIVTNQEAKEQQLFIGKPYACPECAPGGGQRRG